MSKLYAYTQLIRVYTINDMPYNTIMHSVDKVIHLPDLDVPVFFMESKEHPYVRSPEYDIETGDKE